MKSLATLFAASALFSSYAHAGNLICTLSEYGNPKNASTVNVDLARPFEEIYLDQAGVNLGDENYSFDFQLDRNGTHLSISAIFSENNHVEDQVAEGTWTVDLSAAPTQTPVIHDDLTNTSGRTVLSFDCWVNH